jgi:hypothetical protein
MSAQFHICYVDILREPAKLTRVSTIPYMFTYAHRYIVVVIANGMADIAGSAP